MKKGAGWPVGYSPGKALSIERIIRCRRALSITQRKKLVHIDPGKQGIFYLILLILIVIGLPFGIRAYDRRLQPVQYIAGAQEFTLTGHAGRGWVLGEVRANDIISLWRDDGPPVKPVIEVSEGDQLTLRITVHKVKPSRSKPDRGVLFSFCEMLNQVNEVVATMMALNLIRYRDVG